MHRNLLSRPLSRRQLVRGATAASAFALLPARSLGVAQATPGAMSYPELTVTITDDELTTSATEVPSGYVKLTVVNKSKDANSAGLIGPGRGQTMDQLKQAGAAAGNQEFPSFLYTATILGGPGDIQPGDTAHAIVQVAAGDWLIFPEGDQAALPLTAHAGDATKLAEPQAVLTVTEVDFAFGGFDVAIPAGTQVWKVVNAGAQPHMLGLFRGPASMTVAQVLQIANLPETATPPAGALQPSEITEVSGGVILQSPGTTVYPILDLPAGRYAAVCWVPDERTGQPHIMEGMLAVFDVGRARPPTATPAA